MAEKPKPLIHDATSEQYYDDLIRKLTLSPAFPDEQSKLAYQRWLKDHPKVVLYYMYGVDQGSADTMEHQRSTKTTGPITGGGLKPGGDRDGRRELPDPRAVLREIFWKQQEQEKRKGQGTADHPQYDPTYDNYYSPPVAASDSGGHVGVKSPVADLLTRVVWTQIHPDKPYHQPKRANIVGKPKAQPYVYYGDAPDAANPPPEQEPFDGGGINDYPDGKQAQTGQVGGNLQPGPWTDYDYGQAAPAQPAQSKGKTKAI